MLVQGTARNTCTVISFCLEQKGACEKVYNQNKAAGRTCSGMATLVQYCESGSDIRDRGSGAFLPPGSGIRILDEFFPDPGSGSVMSYLFDFKVFFPEPLEGSF
jgi:hypothetical protein